MAISVSAILAVLFYSAFEIDRAYSQREEQMVEQSVETLGRTLTQSTFPQAYWDDAVRNLDNKFSEQWAAQYVGTFFWRTSEWNLISTLDRDDKVTFGMIDGDVAPPIAMAGLRTAAAPLIAAVRKGEQERGPLPKLDQFSTGELGQASPKPPKNPIPSVSSRPPEELRPIAASGIAKVGNSLFLLSATLVQPDLFARPLTDRSAIILLGKRVDEQVLAGVSHGHMLQDLTVLPSDGPGEPGAARARLKSSEGQTVGVLNWTSRHPGAELVRTIMPALAAFVAILLIATVAVLRKGRSLTRELVESEELAAHLAHHDGLTGLPNRRALEATYTVMRDAHRSEGRPFAVLCIDIDNFKSVNDSLGHPAGDQLLRASVEKLAAACKPGDTLGRYGGDEFVVLLADSDAAQASKTADILVQSLAEPIDIEAGRVFVGASIGILIHEPPMDLTAAEAFRRADLAMYRAKDLGRSQSVFFTAGLDDKVRARQTLQQDLHEALARNELTVHYQPQVDGEDRLIGVEALLRWPGAEQRGTTPYALIQLAEETGQIEDISRVVMRKALSDAARWPHIVTAINISPIELRSPDFVPRIAGLVEEAGADPRRFELEITESVLLGRDPDTIGKLEKLRAMGFGIVLDDFGTGYCGLSYLHLYPVDKVKIDMSFVALLGREERGASLIEAIISLASALNLAVVAEGVELPTQRRMLAEMGCSNIQGFLVGRAVPAEVIAPL